MHVQIDKPRHQVFSAQVDDRSAVRRRGSGRLHRQDFSVLDHNRHVLLFRHIFTAVQKCAVQIRSFHFLPPYSLKFGAESLRNRKCRFRDIASLPVPAFQRRTPPVRLCRAEQAVHDAQAEAYRSPISPIFSASAKTPAGPS